MIMFIKCIAMGLGVALLASGCNQQKPIVVTVNPPATPTPTPPDPNVIETKLADGRVLHYTRQQLAEAKTWGYSQATYESSIAGGVTHDALIESAKMQYWDRAHGEGVPTPAEGITPPP
jgi:hypothetical protein